MALSAHFSRRPSPDVPLGGFSPMPGVVVVELDPVSKWSDGGIALPNEVDEDLTPDTGTVVASAHDMAGYIEKAERYGVKVFDHPMPQEGARVLVKPKSGKSVTGFVRAGSKREGFTRFYGFIGGTSPWTKRGDGFSARPLPWYESIIMEFNLDTYFPTKDRLVVEHPVREKSDGGIMLLESLDRRLTVKARVIKAGPLCRDIKEGDVIVYHEGACERITGLPEGTSVVSESMVYGRVV